jgi:two-component system, sensor histidine kinase and response regulator
VSKILVIEDQPDLRMTILDILEAENFETFEAENGVKGVQLAQEVCPDLILCDVMMPEMDGYGVLKSIRQHPEIGTTPFIFLTAKSSMEDLREGMMLGVDDYLTKPFACHDLLQAIAVRLSKQDKQIKQSKSQITSLRQKISYSLLDKLVAPLDDIAEASSTLIENALSKEDVANIDLGKTIFGKTQFLQRAINNFFLATNIDLLIVNAEAVKEIRQAVTINPADFIVMLANQVSQNYNRSEDLYLKVNNAEIHILLNDFKTIMEEFLEFVFSSSLKHTSIHVETQSDQKYFQCFITSTMNGPTAELLQEIKPHDRISQDFFENLDSGLGLITAQKMINLYGGELMLWRGEQRQLVFSISLPIKAKN